MVNSRTLGSCLAVGIYGTAAGASAISPLFWLPYFLSLALLFLVQQRLVFPLFRDKYPDVIGEMKSAEFRAALKFCIPRCRVFCLVCLVRCHRGNSVLSFEPLTSLRWKRGASEFLKVSVNCSNFWPALSSKFCTINIFFFKRKSMWVKLTQFVGERVFTEKYRRMTAQQPPDLLSSLLFISLTWRSQWFNVKSVQSHFQHASFRCRQSHSLVRGKMSLGV